MSLLALSADGAAAGCLMVTVLAGIAVFECSLILYYSGRRKAARAMAKGKQVRPQAEDDEASGARRRAGCEREVGSRNLFEKSIQISGEGRRARVLRFLSCRGMLHVTIHSGISGVAKQPRRSPSVGG